jgi:TRAP-type mannitol/chloroaromatic compound transport system substrate-binding protein
MKKETTVKTVEKQSRRGFLKKAAVVAGGAAGVMGFPGVMRLSAAAPIKWRMQDIMPLVPTMGHWKEILNNQDDYGWARYIGQLTEGRLKIEVIAPDSAYPGVEALTNIGAGVVECCQVMPGWYAGKIPEAYIASGLPFTWKTCFEASDCYYNFGLYERCRRSTINTTSPHPDSHAGSRGADHAVPLQEL